MKTSYNKLSILGLTLCAAMAGVTAPGRAARVSAAPATPTVTVAAQVKTTYLVDPMLVTVRQLTLHIRGSLFTPGATVRIAVMHSSPWKLLATGSTYAQFAIRQCSWTIRACSEPNPQAGTIDYRLRLTNAPPVSSLLVLYRSAHFTGMRDLSLTRR